MVEVFAKPGTKSQAKRDLIFNKTGMIPAIYDNGTHYVANHRLTSEMLEQICKDDDALEVTGEYTGSIGGWGASHEHREHSHSYTHEDDPNTFAEPSSFSKNNQKQEQEQLVKEQIPIDKDILKEEKRKDGKSLLKNDNRYKPIIIRLYKS